VISKVIASESVACPLTTVSSQSVVNVVVIAVGPCKTIEIAVRFVLTACTSAAVVVDWSRDVEVCEVLALAVETLVFLTRLRVQSTKQSFIQSANKINQSLCILLVTLCVVVSKK